MILIYLGMLFFIPILMIVVGTRLLRRMYKLDFYDLSDFELHNIHGFYKSKRAMASENAWWYAQKCVSSLLKKGGKVMTFISLVIFMLWLMNDYKMVDLGDMDIYLILNFLVQIMYIYLIRLCVELKLKKNNG